jgi:hypothetical protein
MRADRVAFLNCLCFACAVLAWRLSIGTSERGAYVIVEALTAAALCAVPALLLQRIERQRRVYHVLTLGISIALAWFAR